MAKNKISDYDGVTAGNNTDIGGISTAEGMLPSTVNNAMRELTKQLGAFADGTDGIDVLNLHDDDESASIKIQAPATVTTTTTLTLPDGAGSNGQVLTTNGSGTLSWTTAAGGLGNVVEDTTPQLGGDLDLNSSDITGTGDINITGTITSDGLTVDNAGGSTLILENSTSTSYVGDGTELQGAIHFKNSDTSGDGDHIGAKIESYVTNSTGGGDLQFYTGRSDADLEKRLEIYRIGDISFYADDGTTQGLFWDASTQRLGLGQTSPTKSLHVNGGSSSVAAVFQYNGSASYIGFSNDTSADGYIGYDNSSNLELWTAGSEKVTITSGGSVGIGTTSPSAKIDINSSTEGDVYFRGGTGATRQLELSTFATVSNHAGHDFNIASDNGVFSFSINGSEAARLDSSGNLLVAKTSTGIGTVGHQIQVNGVAQHVADGASPLQLNRKTSNGSIIDLRKDGTTVGGIHSVSGDIMIGSADTGLRFVDSADAIVACSTNGSQQDNTTDLGRSAFRFKDLRLSGTAYVGTSMAIGTTSPGNELHVYRSTAGTAGRLQSGGTNVSLQLSNSTDADGYLQYNGANMALFTSGSERMRIDSNGNVGIGTTSADGNLHVFGGSAGTVTASGSQAVIENNTTTKLTFLTPAANSAVIEFGDPSDQNVGSIKYDHSNDSMQFKADASEAMRLDSSGNLLIGQNSASNPAADNVVGSSLQAGGQLNVTNDSGVSANFNRKTNDGDVVRFRKDGTIEGSISVTSSGTTYNTTSDIRLKTDIAPIADATDKLMAMNAVTHKWKADPDADAVVGFIAQEMAEIVPEAVHKGEGEDNMWSMDYGRITPVLVAALQDAHNKIEQLEQRIAEMETE